MSKITLLDVLIDDTQVGTITHIPGDQTLFAFNERYIENEGRPTLSLSYKDPYGGLVTESRPYQTRLPPFFSNLLPEGALRHYLAARAGVKDMREFPLLGVLGRDLPGNVTVRPAQSDGWPDGEEAEPDAPRENAMRFSLAGVQLKFSAVMEASGGLTIPATGTGGDWIIKLPSATYSGVPENEFSMLELARSIGIDVPETKLIAVDQIDGLPKNVDRVGANALAIKRFDRGEGGRRIHIEDFAQIFGVYPERKYERASYRNIADVIGSEMGAQAVAEFVKRLTFNILIGNADMHLKNWSLIYLNGRTPALAPAYDYVATIAYIEDNSMALSLAGGGSKKFDEIDLDAFARFAQKARASEKLVLETVKRTREAFDEAWATERAHLPQSKNVSRAIEGHLGELAI